jgi:RNA polymerase sigma-70 factor (ECF subfamily)
MTAPDPAVEAQWLHRAQHARDHRAFAELVNLHQGRVRAVLRKLTHGQHALADELAQECFLKAWQSLPAFRAEARLSTWLHRIAYLEFLQHQRRGQLDASSPVYSSGMDSALTLATDHALRLDVEKSLALLSPLECAAIVHCYHADLSHTEAAQVMGIPLGTLKSHVSRGREKLRHLLSAWQPTLSRKEGP